MPNHIIDLIIRITQKNNNAFKDIEKQIKKLDKTVQQANKSLDTLQSTMRNVNSSTHSVKDAVASTSTSFNKLSADVGAADSKLRSSSEQMEKTAKAARDVERSNRSAGRSFLGLGKNAKTATSNLNNAITAMIGMIGLGQAWDITVGLAIERETSEKAFQMYFGKTLGKDLSDFLQGYAQNTMNLYSELAEGVIGIKTAARWITEEQMEELVPVMDTIGIMGKLLGRTPDQVRYEMKSLGRALAGDEWRLYTKNFEINKQILKQHGWSGNPKDIEGFSAAMMDALASTGDFTDLLSSTYGQLLLIRKGFYAAGREIGETFLPYIHKVTSWMVEQKENVKDPKDAPKLYKYLLGAGVAIAAITALYWPLYIVWQAFSGIVKGIMKFGRALLKLPDTIRKFKDKIIAAKDAIKKLGDKLKDLKSKISSAKDAISGLGGKLKDFASAAKGRILGALRDLVTWLKNLKWATLQATIQQWAMNLAAYANPYVIIAMAIIVLIGALVYLYYTNEDVHNAIDSAWKSITKTFKEAWDGIKWFIDNLSEVFSGEKDPFEFLKQSLNGFLEFLKNNPLAQILLALFAPFLILPLIILNNWDQIKQFFTELPKDIEEAWNNFVSYFSNLWTDITQPFTDFQNQFVNEWNEIEAEVLSIIGPFIYNILAFFDLLENDPVAAIKLLKDTVVKYMQQLVTNAQKEVARLPGEIYNEFASIPDRIRSALGSAVKAAEDFGRGLLNAALGALDRHSPGIIQRETVAEFEETINRINGLSSQARKSSANFSSNLLKGMHVDDLNFSNNFSSDDLKVNHQYNLKHDINLKYDFKNVPSHIDEEKLAEHLKDRGFIKQLVENSYFQKVDAKMKQEITLAKSRNSGVW